MLEWTPSDTIQIVTDLIGITYYFRVRGFDNDGASSPWSNRQFITIENQPPTTPTLNDPGEIDDGSVFTLSWSVSTDPEGIPIQYTLEVFDTGTMDNSLGSWETSSTSIEVNISEMNSGTYYFTVVSQDEAAVRSQWSNVESITVELLTTTTTTTEPPPIPELLIGIIIVGIVGAVILVAGVYVLRRRQS